MCIIDLFYKLYMRYQKWTFYKCPKPKKILVYEIQKKHTLKV